MSDPTGEMPIIAAQAAAPQNEAAPQVEAEEFDAKRAMALIEKLRSEVKELRPKAKQAEELSAAARAKEEAELSELQKANKRLSELDAELKATKRTTVAQAIAAKMGLPAALADRLKGETPEAMEEDAKAILEALPKPQPTAKQPGPVNPGANGAPQETGAQLRQRLTGQTPFSSPFDKGGGVIGNTD